MIRLTVQEPSGRVGGVVGEFEKDLECELLHYDLYYFNK